MPNGLVARSISMVREIVASATSRGTAPTEKQLQRIRQQLQECAENLGGEVSTRQRAAGLAQSYLELGDKGRHAFLRIIAIEFGPNPEEVAEAHSNYQQAIGTEAQWDAEAVLRNAMRSARIRILTQFNAIAQGVKFLVDMRTDLLRYMQDDPDLKPLNRELSTRLTAWFDIGFLELARLSWQSPAAILEKIVDYEAVHEIHSWTDLKNRLDSDRRCYAFFHPRMPTEPLIFVEVALVEDLADNVQKLLDINAPVLDSQQATTAIFYSISNTQKGLRGISFGNFLLKRVIDDLKRDFPKLKQFATLSPIPGLTRWATDNFDDVLACFTATDWKNLAPFGIDKADPDSLRGRLLENFPWYENEALAKVLRAPLMRVAAWYLLFAKRGKQPLDPVARFHLGNGARFERLNWLADTSAKGMKQSWGLMVNYLYDPERLEDNVEAFVRNGNIDAAPAVKRLAAVKK